MRLVQVNGAFDPLIPSPEALLDTYHTLTGWSEAAAQQGLTVSVVQAFSCDGEIRSRRGVDYFFLRAMDDRQFENAMCEQVASRRPDVVHVNGLDHLDLVSALRRHVDSHTAIVVQDHGGPPPGFRRRLRYAWRRADSADGYLFTSREQAQPWIERRILTEGDQIYEVLEASTSIRPVDHREARVSLGVADCLVVLWVGRLDRNKDPLTVIDGFDRFARVRPSAVLLMAYGEDALLPEVHRRLSADSSLAARVRLLGCVPHSDMPRLYSAADLFVLGSHREGSGYALLEACACGALPVVTDIPPFRAITRQGSSGLHWKAGDPGACAEALAQAVRSDPLTSRRHVMARFTQTASWRAVGARARAAYDDVCRRRSTSCGGAP